MGGRPWGVDVGADLGVDPPPPDTPIVEAYFPVKWAERFAPGSLRLLDAGPGAAMFEAMLDADLETGVAVRVLSTKSREARHELEMLGRLRALSLLGVQNFTCIMSDFERVVQGDWTYILVEAPTAMRNSTPHRSTSIPDWWACEFWECGCRTLSMSGQTV